MKISITITLLLLINSTFLYSQNNKVSHENINNKVFITYNSSYRCGNIFRLEFFNDSLFCCTTYHGTGLSEKDIVEYSECISIGKWYIKNDTIILNTVYPDPDYSAIAILTSTFHFENKKLIYESYALKDLETADILQAPYFGKLFGEMIGKSYDWVLTE